MINRDEVLNLIYSKIRPSFTYIHQWCVHEYISVWDILNYLKSKPIAWKRWQVIYNFDQNSFDKFANQEVIFLKKKNIETLKKEVWQNVILSIYWFRIIELKNNNLHKRAIIWKDYHLHEVEWCIVSNWKKIILLWPKIKALPFLITK